MSRNAADGRERLEIWPSDLNDPSRVLEMLRRASTELRRAESHGRDAEIKARDAEQRLNRLADHSATTISEIRKRLTEVEARAGDARRDFDSRLRSVEIQAQDDRDSAAAEIRTLREQLQVAETAAEQQNERAATALGQAREAEQRARDSEQRAVDAEESASVNAARAERAEERAREAERRLACVRDALGPDTSAGVPEAFERDGMVEVGIFAPAPAEAEPERHVPAQSVRDTIGSVIGFGRTRKLRLRAAG
jgi:trichohyalin